MAVKRAGVVREAGMDSAVSVRLEAMSVKA
jgi:hypothetical protein